VFAEGFVGEAFEGFGLGLFLGSGFPAGLEDAAI
jgi:hypothetical protein